MESGPGTYILTLRNHAIANVQIGRLGLLSLPPGYYLYVGSAFGPGGVRARILRHCRQAKRKHWHIDYVSEIMQPVGAWLSHQNEPREHDWAQALYKITNLSAIRGFGCSDCRCYSHLFYSGTAPDISSFSVSVGSTVQTWRY